MVGTLEKRTTNPILGQEDYVKRNALVWNSKLYKEISKAVTMYYNSHRYEMERYQVDLEDLIQKVCFTLYRWKDFDPKAYGKQISQYTFYIINQKIVKDKRNYYKTRKNTSLSMDEEFSNQTSKDSAEMTVADTVADSSYRFMEFMEECLSKIPTDHKFYIDEISFRTRDIFKLLFSGWSGEEIAAAAEVDGKKFRKMKRTLTKEFYSSDIKELYAALPSNVDFRPDYFVSYTKEQSQESEKREESLRKKFSSEVRVSYI